MLDQIEKKMGGPAPRKFGFLDWWANYRPNKPDWDWKNDPEIKLMIDSWKNIFKNGKLGWACTVQANRNMYEKGDTNCPGNILIWTDEEKPADLHKMAHLAHNLYDIKGDSELIDDPEIKAFAYSLENEYGRQMRLDLPQRITDGDAITMTTIYYQRRCLPNGILSYPFYPVAYLPGEQIICAMIPCEFWPDELIEAWCQKEEDEE